MTLTLENFKQEIDPIILDRGCVYFSSGHVDNLEEDDDGMWSAQVEGTDRYHVIINQDTNGELTTQCTCPFDWGPICKHVAAVLFAIEETFNEYKGSKPRKPHKKRKTRTEKIHDTLKSMAHEELVELLVELAGQDRQIATMILARFSDEGNAKKAYISLVKNALNMGKGQYGFIDYYGSGRAARGVRDVLQRADTDLAQGRAINAVPVYQAVLETLVPAISHADDSNGELGDCITFALQGLAQAAHTLSPKEQRQLFNYCVSESQHKRYSGWDWGWDLAQIGADLVETEAQRQKLFEALDKMAISHQVEEETQAWLSKFEYQRAETIKLSVIDQLDDEETRLAFLIDRVDLEPFREKLVRYHMDHENLEEARKLCNEWLGHPESRHRGYQDIFHDLLLEIAQVEKNQNEIIRLAETLFLDTGNFNYYSILKKNIKNNQWVAFRRRLIAQAEKSSRHHNLIPQIFVREEMWRQLLDYVKQSNRFMIEQYSEHLAPHFPDEVAAIYERIIWEILRQKVNRKGYQEACRYIRRIIRLDKRSQAEALIEVLRKKYNNRPALLDELNKV